MAWGREESGKVLAITRSDWGLLGMNQGMTRFPKPTSCKITRKWQKILKTRRKSFARKGCQKPGCHKYLAASQCGSLSDSVIPSLSPYYRVASLCPRLVKHSHQPNHILVKGMCPHNLINQGPLEQSSYNIQSHKQVTCLLIHISDDVQGQYHNS